MIAVLISLKNLGKPMRLKCLDFTQHLLRISIVNKEKVEFAFAEFLPFLSYLDFVSRIFVADSVLTLPLQNHDISFLGNCDEVRIKLSFTPTLDVERIYFLAIAYPKVYSIERTQIYTLYKRPLLAVDGIYPVIEVFVEHFANGRF